MRASSRSPSRDPQGIGAEAADASTPAARPRAWRPSRTAALVLAVGLLVTAALSLTSLAVYNRNERRLLNLRVRELNLVLAASAPATQTPLASAAELASATGGSAAKFRAFLTPYVGRGKPFMSVSLWPLGTPHLAPVAVLGTPPALAPERAAAFFAHAKGEGKLNVTGIMGTAHPSLGYAVLGSSGSRGFAVYAESLLPANRRSRLESNSAFSDLDYVLYLGRTHAESALLVTSVRHLPIHGRQASETVPFGAGQLTLVVAARGSLGGAFFASLPWIIALVGATVALAAALMTDRLARRRARAEDLALTLDRVAAENRRMYTEQRSISQALQHALLPDSLPTFTGLTVDARYVPAASGVDVGGDWYDFVEVDDRCVFLVIGDVSGHGLRAATTMALVRHATLAYAAQDAQPASVLSKLSDFVNRGEHDYFATVLCALIDVDEHRVTLASAGHMAPLLIESADGDYVDFHVDAPIGVPWGSKYRETVISVPSNATLVAFTDGLVERRGEVLDVGLARLRELATGEPLALDALLARLALELAVEDLHDDTAIVGIQWQS